MSDDDDAPIAFGGSRLGWRDLPREIRSAIQARLGAEVISETSATSGFSPGFVGILELATGTEVFVKAVSPEQNEDAPRQARREATVVALLPPEVPAPRLLWSDVTGDWVLLAYQAIQGAPPQMPWRPDELRRVLDAVAQLAVAGTPAPEGIDPIEDRLGDRFRGWQRLVEGPPDERAAVADAYPWAARHLDRLVDLERHSRAAMAGNSLVHGDLRADNVLFDERRTWLIDWAHAGVGAVWLDLLLMLPSVVMQGGSAAEEIFGAHPTTRDADPDAVRAVLAGLAGCLVYESLQPAPTGLPNLRAFQAGQAGPALDWLRRLL